MQKLLLLPLVLITACSNSPSPDNYSFELSDKVISSSLEKEDESGEYLNSCSRSVDIAWELNIKPKDFTGMVYFEHLTEWGDLIIDEPSASFIPVREGKMDTVGYYEYVTKSSSSEADYKSICAFNDAKKLSIKIDRSSLLMLPGVSPKLPQEASPAK